MWGLVIETYRHDGFAVSGCFTLLTLNTQVIMDKQINMVYVFTYMHVCMFVCINVCMHACMYV